MTIILFPVLCKCRNTLLKVISILFPVLCECRNSLKREKITESNNNDQRILGCGGAFPSLGDGFTECQRNVFSNSEKFPFLNDQLNSNWNLIPDQENQI